MATVVVERAWRESTPEMVEDDLAAVWRDLAARGAVARAVMSNLVVFRFHERRGPSDRTADEPGPVGDVALEAVMALHPSRTIVIEHDRGDHGAQAPMGAGVGVCVFGPPTARYGVEEVVVKSACADVSLPSVVRRFVRGDLPTTVWWTEDASRWPPLPALVGTGRQLLYDSRAWRDVHAGFRAIAPLAAGRQVDVADLNWRRLAPLRRALVHAAEQIGVDARVRVHIAYRPGDAAIGWLLAGWLAARLGWPDNAWAPVEEAGHANEIVTLTIGEGAAALTATLDGHRVLVRQAGVAPMTVPAPRDSAAEAIAAELRSLSHDVGLHDALAALGTHHSNTKL